MQNTQGKGGEGFSAAAVAAAQTISLGKSYPLLLWRKVCVVCIVHVCGYITCGPASCGTYVYCIVVLFCFFFFLFCTVVYVCASVCVHLVRKENGFVVASLP